MKDLVIHFYKVYNFTFTKYRAFTTLIELFVIDKNNIE